MNALDLVSDLRRRGVALWAEGTRLRFRAPRGILQVGDRAALSAQRAEILGLLAVGSVGTGEAIAAYPPSIGSPPSPSGREEVLDALYRRVLTAPAIARCPGGCGREVVWSDPEADPGVCFDCGTAFVPVGPPGAAGSHPAAGSGDGRARVGGGLGEARHSPDGASVGGPVWRGGRSAETATGEPRRRDTPPYPPVNPDGGRVPPGAPAPEGTDRAGGERNP